MKIKHILSLIAVVLLASCVKDNSDKGGRTISKIAIENTYIGQDAKEKRHIKEEYRQDRHNIIAINCPPVSQTGREKPLSYRWEVDYEIVSTEKDLVFDCPKYSTTEDGFPCRFVVSNEDGESWVDFRLRVTDPFEIGLLVMSELDGGTYFSFKREGYPDGAEAGNAEDQGFILDAYNLNNPNWPLGRKPKCMAWHGNYIWVGTENPTVVAKLVKKTFETDKIFKYPKEHIDYMISAGNDNGIMFVSDGKLLDMDTSQDSFINFVQQMLDMEYPDAHVEAMGMRMYKDDPRYGLRADDAVMYERNYGFLFKANGWGHTEFTPGRDGTGIDMSGRVPLAIVPVKSGQEALVVVETAGVGTEILYIDPFSGKTLRTIDAAGTGIGAGSAFLGHKNKVFCYYSVGNGIYSFNYSGGAGMPQTPVFTVGGSGDVIRRMVFNSDESRMYVAYERQGAAKAGCVAAVDIENDAMELAWDHREVAGTIVEMMYKDK